MNDKTNLVACSGLNPRGNLTRAAVSDITSVDENFSYSCIVACGGGNEKHIQRTIDNKTIAVNGCNKNCPKNILENQGGKVDKSLDIKELLKEHDLLPKDPVRISEDEEKSIKIIKEEIYKINEGL